MAGSCFRLIALFAISLFFYPLLSCSGEPEGHEGEQEQQEEQQEQEERNQNQEETCSTPLCDGVCCASGESCLDVEICDGEDCQVRALCRTSCAGDFCGASGDLCCEGDHPVCNPRGSCAPSCEGEGPLCGEAFDQCCPLGDLCVFGECRTPGAPCSTFIDCDFGEYCDQGIQRCMPDEFPEGLQCFLDFAFDPFDVEELWSWEGVDVNGVFVEHVASTPAVADITGDGTPEVAFIAYGDPNQGVLVVLSGANGAPLYVNDTLNLRIREHVALADVDGDGRLEIVVATNNGVGVVDDIISCPDPDDDADGCFLWSESVPGSGINQAPFVADLTGDGLAEVIYLHSVFRGATGELLGRTPQGQASMPVVVDLTGNGEAEILTAGCAWRLNADPQNTDPEEGLEEVWCNPALPGYDSRHTNDRNYIAVGDVLRGDRAGLPEVIWVGDGQVFLLDEGGELLMQLNLPGAVRGGPPVVADFDGDGRAEFAVGGQTCYTVFDADCLGSDDADLPGCTRPTFEPCTPGEDCVIEPCAEVPGGTGDGILWSIEIVDSVTGTGFASAVFDFQGNGRHEVVFGDHCRVFILDGQTGSPLLTRFASRRANSEMPIVVDVNGDGRSNLLYQANSDLFDRDCVEPIATRPDFFPECHGDNPPDYCAQGNQGLFAMQDANDLWVRTRAIWNQHAYYGDNVLDDGSMPDAAQRPWTTHNTFRASRQGDIPLNSPDIAVTSALVTNTGCPPDLRIQATIENQGMSSVPAGLPITLRGPGGEALVTSTLSEPLLPGGVTTVELIYTVPSFYFNQYFDLHVVANDDGSEAAIFPDCNPDSATYLLEDVICRYAL